MVFLECWFVPCFFNVARLPPTGKSFLVAMALQSHHDLIPKDKLAPIVESLEGIAAKKELRPRTAYQIFVKEKLQKANKAGGGRANFGEAAAQWKALSAKQKEPYLKMNKDEVAKSDAIKKEFGQTFEKHWKDLEKHLEAEEKIKEEKMTHKKAAEKAKVAEAKKTRLMRKKHAQVEKKKRAAVKQRSATLVSASRSLVQAPTPRMGRAAAGRTSSTSRIAELSRGLETSSWEVRESTSRPGFFYYLNKKTRQSTAERPKNSRAALHAGKGLGQRQRVR